MDVKPKMGFNPSADDCCFPSIERYRTFLAAEASSSASFTESPRRPQTEHRADSEYEITLDSNNIIMRPGRKGAPTVLMRPDIFDRHTITTNSETKPSRYTQNSQYGSKQLFNPSFLFVRPLYYHRPWRAPCSKQLVELRAETPYPNGT